MTLVEAERLLDAQPVGTFLVFGDGETASILMKRSDGWGIYRDPRHIDGPDSVDMDTLSRWVREEMNSPWALY